MASAGDTPPSRRESKRSQSVNLMCQGNAPSECLALPGTEKPGEYHVYSAIPRLVKVACVVAFVTLVGIVSRTPFALYASALPTSAGLSARSLSLYIRQAVTPLLDVFQVYPPVLTPSPAGTGEVVTNGSSGSYPITVPAEDYGCVAYQTLMVHVFAYSYGMPYVGSYAPPANCGFNRVTFNLTVTSAGRQFDRLGIVYFGDTEIWRTSTAEPTQTGIIWEYIKDMSHYLALLREPQKLIFDLGNLVDSTYTASYNATLTATFFNSPDTVYPADEIVPVSARQSVNNAASVFSVPSQNASNTITLPRNIRRAFFSIAATGQIDEEFWYSNVLSSEVNTFPALGALLGFSPFREVQLYIDGLLAGVVWPFPIIFTGGVVPGFWRPIVGIDAFDLREDVIDITPWLPLLCDGASHTFDIQVAGINDDGHNNGQLTETVGSYWLVTGKIFIWLDPVGSITTGSALERSVPNPLIQLTSSIGQDSNGTNETLTYDVKVSRQLSISSQIHTAHGTKLAHWQQTLEYSNYDALTAYGFDQLTVQNSSGIEISSDAYARNFAYPITLFSAFSEDATSGNLSINGTINRGQDIQIFGQPIFPTGLQSFENFPSLYDVYPAFQGSNLETTQNGSASYFSSPALPQSSSSGTTQQDMVFEGLRIDQSTPIGTNGALPAVVGSTELYERHVLAVNGAVVSNDEVLVGEPIIGFRGPVPHFGEGHVAGFAGSSPMSVLGRGRGGRQGF